MNWRFSILKQFSQHLTLCQADSGVVEVVGNNETVITEKEKKNSRAQEGFGQTVVGLETNMCCKWTIY